MNDVIKEWKIKQLDPCYVFVYITKEELYIRENYSIKKRNLYILIGINVEGKKRILGAYIENNDDIHFWMNIFEEIKFRGVNDIIFLMTGNNKQLKRGVKLVFSEVEIVPLLQEIVDNSTKYIARKHYRELSVKLYHICIQNKIEDANKNLEEYMNYLENDDIVKYIMSQYKDELLKSYKYNVRVRKMMYSMSMLDRIRRGYKKIIKQQDVYTNEDILLFEMLKIFINIEKTWVYSKREWNDIINLIGKEYKDRVFPYLY